MSREERNRAWPPSWKAPTSNETRVRVEILAKIIASVLPAGGFSRESPRFMRAARSKTARSSGLEKSGIARKWRGAVIGRGDCSKGWVGWQFPVAELTNPSAALGQHRHWFKPNPQILDYPMRMRSVFRVYLCSSVASFCLIAGSSAAAQQVTIVRAARMLDVTKGE